MKRLNAVMLTGALMLGAGSGIFAMENVSDAATKLVKTDAFDKDGKVTKITSKKVVFKRQTGSSPVSWAKAKKLTISDATKFYKCKGYNGSYTKYKLQSVGKSAAINAIKNNKGNYVFFKSNGKKATMVVYGLENFVG